MSFDGLRSFGNSLPLAGGLLEGIWGSPEQEKHQAEMARSAKQIEAYRPINQQARMNAFSAGANAFGPMNNLMAQMYGPQAQMDFSKIVQNPMPTSTLQPDTMSQLPAGVQADFHKFPKHIQEKILAAQAAQNKSQQGGM